MVLPGGSQSVRIGATRSREEDLLLLRYEYSCTVSSIRITMLLHPTSNPTAHSAHLVLAYSPSQRTRTSYVVKINSSRGGVTGNSVV